MITVQRGFPGCLQCGYTFEEMLSQHDIDIYHVETLRELAEKFVDEGLYGEIPESLQYYCFSYDTPSKLVDLINIALQCTKDTAGPVRISRRAGFERLCACGKASIFVEEIERLEVVGRALSQTAQSFQVILPRSTLLPDRPAPGEAGVFDDVPVRIRGQAARLCRLMQKRVAHVVRVLRVTARPAPPQRTKATKRPSTRTESRRSESRSAKVHPKKLLVERDL